MSSVNERLDIGERLVDPVLAQVQGAGLVLALGNKSKVTIFLRWQQKIHSSVWVDKHRAGQAAELLGGPRDRLGLEGRPGACSPADGLCALLSRWDAPHGRL